MTKATTSTRHAAAAAILCLLSILSFACPVAAASVEAPVELSAVLAATRIEPPARVRFSESRHNPLFDEPLELEGYVEYLGPGVLRKVIESPFEETFLIDAGKVSVQSNGETRRLPARSSKALATLLGAIEAILSGNEEPLRDSFDYDVTGSAGDWHIELRPRARRLAKRLSSVSIEGGSATVDEIRTDLEGGEQHVMRLHHDAAQQ